jgi:hypothetical protein
MRSSFLLSAVLLVACTCERSPTSQLPAKAKHKASGGQSSIKQQRGPDSRSWHIGARPSMAKLAAYAGEVSGRVSRGGSFAIAAPAKALDSAVAAIPDSADPGFAGWKQKLKERTAALHASTDSRKEFNQVIEACVGCHIRYAPASLSQVQALRVSLAPLAPKK